MNEIFNFHGQEVRTLTIDDEPWFVGKDVADILGYAKPLDAISRHVDEDDSVNTDYTDNLGRTQNTITQSTNLVSTLLSYPASCLRLKSLSAGLHQRSCQLFASREDLSARIWTRMPLLLSLLARRNCVSNKLA